MVLVPFVLLFVVYGTAHAFGLPNSASWILAILFGFPAGLMIWRARDRADQRKLRAEYDAQASDHITPRARNGAR